ncbi:MAG TPA: hypothetical protein VGG22_10195 [Candidatus Baltobacteraceae bacterium]
MNHDEPSDGQLEFAYVQTFTAGGNPRQLAVTSKRSKALFVVNCAEDEVDRVFKTTLPDLPLIPLHELVAALLARAAGIPVLNPCIVKVDEQSWFGMDYLTGDQKLEYSLSGPIFDEAENARGIVYEAVCLDAWLLNPDRHDDNLLLRLENAAKSIWRAYVIDHNKALGSDLPEAMAEKRLDKFSSDFASWVDHTTAWLHPQASWTDRVVSFTCLEKVAERIQGIPSGTIDAVMQSIPASWASGRYVEAIRSFVLSRQKALPAILRTHRDKFPRLGL